MRAELACFAVIAGAFGLTAAGMTQAPSRVELHQGWDEPTREGWYAGTQGSRLVPYAWWKSLERPGGGGLFADDAYVASFRYLPRPGRLPVGFALDNGQRDTGDAQLGVTKLRWREGQGAREPWLGFNCSACHTNEIHYTRPSGERTVLRVDGAPTLADFQSFIGQLNLALQQTRDDPARFDRFAGRVLSGADTPANRALLRRELARYVDHRLKLAALDRTSLAYGYGRLDAVGHIFNKVVLIANPTNPVGNEPDAPVSYPFLWNVPQHQKVQWNGFVSNSPVTGVYNTPKEPQPSPFAGRERQSFDFGALGRNVGEVVGVFADVRPRNVGPWRSSVQVDSLVGLELTLSKLKPPAWPSAVFGAPDPALVREGRELFGGRCAGCHRPLERADLHTNPVETMTDLSRAGTDPWMACNFTTHSARTGLLRGKRARVFGGPRLAETDLVGNMTAGVVFRVILGEAKATLGTATDALRGRQGGPVVIAPPAGEPPPRALGPLERRAARRELCERSAGADTLAYKARPLAGVWATAPYLHNGSVPTLYELLLPPHQRRRSFYTGTREFDPRTVGFVTEERPDNPFEFRTVDQNGRPIEGNSNGGHDYNNASLSDRQRGALVEYMKTIGESAEDEELSVSPPEASGRGRSG